MHINEYGSAQAFEKDVIRRIVDCAEPGSVVLGSGQGNGDHEKRK